MTILFDASAPVKLSPSFGAGILPAAPVTRVDHTAEDASWWAAESARRDEAEFNRLADELASERLWQDLYESGRLTDEDVVIATGCAG
jgi:hypothetical protein